MIIQNSTHIGQWKESYEDFSNCNIWCVGEDKEIPENFDVIICLYTRVKKIDQQILDRVGLLIVDECDCFCNRTGIEAMLLVSPKYVLMCTATYERDDGLHKVIEYISGPDNRVISKDDLKFDVFRFSTGIKGIREKGWKGRLNFGKLLDSLLYNNERNQLIFDLVFHLLQEGEKIIIITARKKHARILSEFIMKIFEENGLPYTSDYFTGDKKQYIDCDVLVGNWQMCGRGFDEEKYCPTFNGIRISSVIMACSFKSINPLYQSIGRGLRSRCPRVYQLVDKDSTIEGHWRGNRKWYISIGAEVSTFRLPSN